MRPRVTDVVFRICCLLTIAFLVQSLTRIFLGPQGFLLQIQNLALFFDTSFHFLQLLTHPLTNLPSSFVYDLFHLLFIIALFIILGSSLEAKWGSHYFASYVIFSLLGGIFMAFLFYLVSLWINLGISGPFYGMGAALASLMIAYAILWPQREVLFLFVFPMKMKWVILLMFCFLALTGTKELFTLYLGGALFGTLFLYYHLQKGSKSFIRKQGDFLKSASDWEAPTSTVSYDRFTENKENLPYLLKKRQKFSIWEYWKEKKDIERRKNIQVQNEDNTSSMRLEVDTILEKISKHGMDSLTKEERDFLKRASAEL